MKGIDLYKAVVIGIVRLARINGSQLNRAFKTRSSSFLRVALPGAIMALTFLATPVAQAVGTTWLSLSGGDWNTAGYWSGGVIPTSTGTALFSSALTAPVTNAAPVSIGNITFDTGANSIVIGTVGGPAFSLASGNSVTLASTLTGTNMTETINAPIRLAAGSYTFANNSNSIGNSLVFGGGITGTTLSSTLTLSAASLGTNTINGVISNGGSWPTCLIKSGNGLWILGGQNTFTGQTTILGGELSVNSIGGPGVAGALGESGSMNIGSTVASGILIYTGSGETTNKSINLAGTTGGATLSQSGSGLLNFTGNLTASATGSKTLTLAGNTSGTGQISGNIPNPGIGSLSLTALSGNWVLGGSNTYTGTTLLNEGGALALNFAAPGAPQNNIIGVASTLNFGIPNMNQYGNATLTLIGAANTANSQTFSQTAYALIFQGAATINLNPGNNGSLMLNLGTGHGRGSYGQWGQWMNINVPAGVTLASTPGTNTATVLFNPGGAAIPLVVNGLDFCVQSGSAVIPASNSYATNYATFSTTGTITSIGANLDVTTNLTGSANALVGGGIRFNTPTSNTLTIQTSLGNSLGATLVTPNVGANLSKITGGFMMGFSGRDQSICQNNPFGNLEIDSVVAPFSINPSWNSQSLFVDGTGAAGGSGTAGLVILNGGVSFGSAAVQQGITVVGFNSVAGFVTSGTLSGSTLTLSSTAGLAVGGFFGGVYLPLQSQLIYSLPSSTTVALSGSGTNGSSTGNFIGSTGFEFGGLGGLGGVNLPGVGSTAFVAPGATLQIGGTTSGAVPVTGGTSGNLAACQSVNLQSNGVQSGTLILYRNDNASYATSGTGLNFGNQIYGMGTVVKSGTGLVILSASNSFVGDLQLNGGTLSIPANFAQTTAVSGTALGMIATTPLGLTPFASGTNVIGVPNASPNMVGMAVSGGYFPPTDYVTAVSGTWVTLALSATNIFTTGTITFGANNVVAVANPAGLAMGQGIVLPGFASTNTISSIYGNIVTLSAGLLTTVTQPTAFSTGTYKAYSVLPTTVTITFNGGTLQYGAGNTIDYSARFNTAPGQQISIDTNGNNVAYATGLTSSGGSFAKIGLGTLTLNGNNTYSGNSTISGGQLNVNGALASPVIVQNAGVLGGSGTIGNSVTLNGGTLQTANGLIFNGLNVNSGGTLSSGTVNVGSTPFSITSGEFDVNGQLTSTNGAFVGGGASQATLGGTGTVLTGAFPVTLCGNGSLQGGSTGKGAGILNLSNGVAVSGTGNTIANFGVVGAANTTLSASAALILSGSLTGNVSVQSTGAVLSGNGSLGGNLVVGAGGAVAPGTAAASGTLSVGGNTVLLDGGTVTLQVGMTGNGASVLAIGGRLDNSGLSGQTFILELAALPGDATTWTGGSKVWYSVITTNGNFASFNVNNIVIDATALLGTDAYNSGFSLAPDSANPNNLDLIYALGGVFPPVVTTGSANGTTYNSTTFNGMINPKGLDTTYYFNYGTTTAYGSVTAVQDSGTGAGPMPVSAAISGLSPVTTYHYQLVAASSSGTTYGLDQTVTTANEFPAVTTGTATGTVYNATVFNGTVNPNGLDTTCYFNYGTTTAYGSVTSGQDVGSGTSATAASAAMAGLNPMTTYHYQLVAVNSSGTTYGLDRAFTTANPPPTVTTNLATGTVYNAATLNGTVDPNGLVSVCYFQYGITTDYGTTTTTRPAGSGTSGVPESASVTGLTASTSYHCQLVAINSSGTTFGLDQTFTTANPPPTVTTGTATGTVYNAATLNGTVNPNGLTTTLYFQYGTTTAYGAATSTQPAGSGTSPIPASAVIAGLNPTTTYHYQLVAANSSGTTYGLDQTFTTANPPPVVVTGSATGTVYNATTLNGTVNPSGLTTDCYFQYGVTTSYGSATTAQAVGSDGSPVPTSAAITGLAAATAYHYQLVAINSSGTSYGLDQTVTTANPPPTVAAGTVTGISSAGGTLNGTVNPNGLATTYSFQYGMTGTYGSATAIQAAGGGSSAAPVSGTITGLGAATTYHWRLVAANSSGTSYGADQTFVTQQSVPSWAAPTGYQNSMLIYSQVQYNGQPIATGSGSMLAAFANGTCAGVAQVVSSPAGPAFQLQVWSNQTSMNGLTLQVFDAATGIVWSIGETLDFVADTEVGAILTPVIYQAGSSLIVSVVPNWNWISFNVLPITSGSTDNSVGAVLAGYSAQTNDVIKSVNGSATYANGQWWPSPGFTIDPDWMYKLQSNGTIPQQFSVFGTALDATVPIALVSGWNWIGYKPQQGQTASVALGSLQASTNDLVKSPDGSATYASGQWWLSPSGYQMVPGKGYMLNVATAQNFTFQPGSTGSSSNMVARMFAAASPKDKPDWQSPAGMQYSMIVYAVVTNASGQPAATGSGSMLAAFLNGTCAGVVRVGNGPSGSLFQLQVWSNKTTVSGMILEVYDAATGTVSNITQLLDFSDNSSVGSILSPTTYTEPAPSFPPTVTTGTANAMHYDGSTLNETVNPNGLTTTCYFQYGTTASFGSTTGTQSIGSGTSAVPVSAVIAGLNPATTYYYQLVTTNSGGTSYGPLQSFTTTQALNYTPNTAQIAQSGNDIQVSLQSLIGYRYQLQRASSLPLGDWQAVGSAQPGTGSLLILVDTDGVLLNKAFYRIQISQ